MKKLIALLFCLAVMATFVRAEYPNQEYPKDGVKKLPNKVHGEYAQRNRKIDNLLNAQKLRVQVTLTAQTPYDEHRNLKNVYECVGFIINKTGDVAIHKGCAEALNVAQREGTGHVALHVDMRDLGNYKANGDRFYYEASSVEPALFVERPDYLLFALPLSPNSEVKAALQKQFTDRPGFTKEQVSALVKLLPPVKKQKTL